MCYETEKTALLFMISKDNKIFNITIPLPKRIRVMIDNNKKFAEIRIFDTIFKELPKDIYFFSLTLTNSPYTRHEGFLTDLGMYCFGFRFTRGYLTQEKNCLVYTTNDFADILVKPTIPQRRITEKIDFEKTLNTPEFVIGSMNKLQIIDFVFNKNLENRIHSIQTYYDYTQNIGQCRMINFSLKSIFAKTGVIKETNFLDLHKCQEWMENQYQELKKIEE